jgi:DNA (cytosine-5)-methyltransferase 1
VIKIVKPKVFVFENVKGILSMNNGDIFKEIIKEFSDPNNFEGNCYNVSYKIIKCQDFGIPQKRERLILIGTLNVKIDLDEEIIKAKLRIKEDFPDFFITQTVWDAISNLPDPKSDGTVLINGNNSSYQDYLFSNIEVKNHYETTHSLITKERMNKIKENENFMVLNEEIKSVHSGSYGRLSKTDICPTITTRFDTPSGGRFIHPASNRTLTPREAARIQSFPDSFIFYGNKTIIHKEIGNAVPPKISRFLGELIKGVLNEQFK